MVKAPNASLSTNTGPTTGLLMTVTQEILVRRIPWAKRLLTPQRKSINLKSPWGQLKIHTCLLTSRQVYRDV